MTDYLKLVQQDNPYTDLVQADTAQTVRQAVAGAASLQPDTEAKLRTLADKVGAPVESVRLQQPEIERRATIGDIDYDKLVRETPVTAQFLTEQAAVARDDVGTLARLENYWTALKLGTEKGSLQEDLAPLHYRALVGEITPAEQQQRAQLKAKMQATQTQADAANTGPLAWFLGATGYTGRQLVTSLKEGGKGAAVGAAAGAGTAAVLGQLGPQVGLPEELVTVPGAAIWGGRAGFITASTVYNYKAEAGFAFDEFEGMKDTDGRPMSREVAQGAAAAVGLLNAGLETMGDLALAKMIPGLDKLLTAGPKSTIKSLLARPTARAALAAAGKKWLKSSSIEGVTEGVQELITILGREVAGGIADGTFQSPTVGEDASRVGQAAAEAFAGAGGVGSPGAAVQARSNLREVRRAQQTQDVMQALGETSTASKLRERLPEQFRAFVAKAKEAGPIENVFIPAQQFTQYFQSVGVNPAQVAEEIGAKNYSEAAAAGTDVVIPLEDYATWLAPTEHHAGLMPDVKLHQGDLTMREAEAFEAEREVVTKKLAADAKALEGKPSPAVEQVKQEILGELVNRYELGTAEAYATLYAKTIATLAERAGMDPMELHKSYGLRVVTPLPPVLQKRAEIDTNLDPLLDRLRAGDIPSEAEAYGPSLYEFIRDRGGLKPQGEVKNLDESIERRPGQRKLTQEKGLSLDYALEAAIEAGYFPGKQPGDLSESDILDALDDDVRGKRRFSMHNEDAELANLRQSLDALDEYLQQLGADLSMDNAALKALLERGAVEPGEQEFAQGGKDITETEAFKKWFGDSKVVDDNSKPLVVYHGTDKMFSAFSTDMIGAESGLDTDGFFFAGNREIATGYAERSPLGDARSGGRVIEAYLSLRNPAQFTTSGSAVEHWDNDIKYHVDRLREAGNDGVIVRGSRDDDLYVAFNPEQIKSATDNRGTFDPNDPNILSQDRRGFIQFGKDRKFTIGLLEKADLSTFLHETGHFWLEVMGDLAARPGSSEQIKQDYQTLLDWFGVKDRSEIKTEQHEQFARANEAYLMEGKAPSAELRSAFQRFRAWLGLIYRTMSSLNVKLNDDVRAVFDRIYATDNEIEAASRQLDVQPLFATAAEAGMTNAEFDAYSKHLERSTADAKDKLQAELMREYQRTREKWWKDKRVEMRDAVEKEIDALPQYQAFAALTAGKLPDGTPVKLNKDDLVRRFGAEYLKRLPRGKGYVYALKAGTDADTAAEMLGYKSGEELVKALVNLRPRKDVIEAETDKRMAEQYGDMRLDGTVHDEAMAALHNEQRAAVIASELRALSRLQAQARPVLAAKDRAERQDRAAALSIPPADVFRDAAKGMVGQMQVKDLQPHQYLLAERRASKAAFEAAAKKDYQTAAIEKQRELMNHHLYLAASKAKAEMDGVYEYAGKFDKPATRQRLGKAGADYLEQIDAILERYEFRKVSLKQLSRRKSLAEFAQQMEQQGLLVNVPDALLDDARTVNYREAQVDELRAVRDVVKNIEHLASLKGKLLRKQQAVDFDDAKGELIGTLLANFKSGGALGKPNRVGETVKEKGARLWRVFDAAHLKVEQLVEWMDGGAKNGPWARYFFDLADDAQAREYDLHREVTAKLQALSDAMGKEWISTMADKTDLVLPGINGPITRYTLLSIALNAGNESNLQRLRDGFAWSDGLIASVLDKLNEKDWQFVQGVWDTVDHLWPEIVALEKRVTGVAPPKIETRKINTAFGDFRGGYFPLAYDPKSSSIGEKQAEQAESVAQFMASAYGRAQTSKGHTKERVAEIKGHPLLLDFEQVLGSHLGKVIKDISHREAVYSLNKILHDQDVKKALIDTVGEEHYRELNKWSQVLIADRADTLHQATGMAGMVMKFRTNMAIVTMGWKISTMMAQFAGFGPSADLVKPRYLTQALVDFNRYGPWSTHRETLLAFVHERSGEMRNRSDTLERDVKDALRRMQGDTSPAATVRKTAFYLTAMADRQVTVPTWLGAYRQGLAEGLSEEDAIRAGDRAVRLSQGAGGAKDLAAVQRNNELQRLLTMFYSPFSVLYARLRDVGHTTRRVQDMPRAAARLLALVVFPAVLGDLLAGRGPDDDEDEVWWAIRKTLLYPIASVPVVRDLSSYIEAGIIGATGEGEMRFAPSFQLSPVVGAIDKLARTAFQKIPDAITGDRPWDDVAWDSLEASGYVFGLPTAQIRITGEYLTDVLTDQANPESPQEALHDLLFRRPKQ